MRRALSFFLALSLISLCACATQHTEEKAGSQETVFPSPSAKAEERLFPAPVTTQEPASEPAPEPTSEPEASLLKIEIRTDQRATVLQDGRTETCCRFAPGTSLTITAEEEIGGLSLIWYDRPQTWILEWEGGNLSCGTQGFLHEFVPLPDSARELTIRFPETESVRLSEICAYSPGRLPDTVQVWEEPCEKADILLIPTHADDEFVFFGGIIPVYAAERGLDVQVMYMISHYGSLRIRCHELLDALWYAGIRHYPVVNDAPDREIYSVKEAENLYGEDSFVDFQVEQIRRFRPLVIVTHDENGEYRQGNHMFTALSLERAVVLASEESYQSESAERWGVWDTPKTYLHLYGEESDRTVLDFETPLEAFGGKTAFSVAKEAFALHASQAQWHFRVYESGHPYDSHSYGLFRSLVGPDVEKTDLMENLASSDWREG